MQNDPIEDGMALYRQQSLIVSRKKEACAERLNHVIQEMTALEGQLQVSVKSLVRKIQKANQYQYF